MLLRITPLLRVLSALEQLTSKIDQFRIGGSSERRDRARIEPANSWFEYLNLYLKQRFRVPQDDADDWGVILHQLGSQRTCGGKEQGVHQLEGGNADPRMALPYSKD